MLTPVMVDGSQATPAGPLLVRRSEERGHADHGWLDTYHTFSFAGHYDPAWMGYRNLRVLNQDKIQADAGFPPHAHRDMEIVSFVLEGALAHEDSMGNRHTIRPGEVQRMSAGTGVVHSEWNAADGITEFLQMWVMPSRRDLEPSYDQRRFDLVQDRFVQVAVPAEDGDQRAGQADEGPVRLNAHAWLHACLPPPGTTLRHRVPEGRHAWLHVARGAVEVLDERLGPGDAAGVEGPVDLQLDVEKDAVLVLWELP